MATINCTPLQLYSSTLLFSPTQSVTRRLFEDPLLEWMAIKPPMEPEWNIYLQTIEGARSCVAFSPDCRYLASESEDHTIGMWHIPYCEVYQKLVGHSGSITSLVFSSDGQCIASTACDETVRIWNPATGDCLHIFYPGCNIISLAFSLDPDCLVSVSCGGEIMILKPGPGGCSRSRRSCNNSSYQMPAAISKDGQYVAILSDADSVPMLEIWDVAKNLLIQSFDTGFTYSPQSYAVYPLSFAFSPDGLDLAATLPPSCIKIWNFHTGNCRLLISGVFHDAPLVYSPDGRYIVTATERRHIGIWCAHTGHLLCSLLGYGQNLISMAFSADFQYFALGYWESNLRLMDAVKIRENAPAHLKHTKSDIHSQHVKCIKFSPDSRYFVSVSLDTTVRIWNAETGCLLQALGTATYRLSRSTQVLFSADSLYVALYFSSFPPTASCVQIWCLRENTPCLKVWSYDSVLPFGFSQDSQAFITIDWPSTNIHLWKLDSSHNLTVIRCPGEVAHTFGSSHHLTVIRCPKEVARIFAISPDGQYVAAWVRDEELMSSEYRLNILSVITGSIYQTIQTWRDSYCERGAFSPDGQYIMVVNGKDCEIWGTYTAHHHLTFPMQHHDPEFQKIEGTSLSDCVAFSSHHNVIALPALDNIEIWSLRTGFPLMKIRVGAFLYRLLFDPTGVYLHTDIGRIYVDPPNDPVNLLRALMVQKCVTRTAIYHGYHLSPDQAWILFNAKKFLRIPPEYRPDKPCSVRFSLDTSAVVIGCNGGQVKLITFPPAGPESRAIEEASGNVLQERD